MNIALGFGSIETEFEASEEKAFCEHVETLFRERGLGYFTHEFVKEIEAWVEERTRTLRAAAKRHDVAADHPDRYGYYYGSIAESASDIVLVAKFQHINRRHGLSPDGWALLQSKRLFHVSSIDIDPAR